MPRRHVGPSLLAALAAMLLFAAPASAADFSQRFGVNDSGDVAILGNALLTCPASTACTNAKAATTAAAGLANNDFAMIQADTDADATTFNSSGATLALPEEATVLFAGLYWGARTTAGTNGAAAPDAAQKRNVKLAAPGGAYQAVAAAAADEQIVDGDAYQEFADVTAAVKAGGAGAYRVANVQAATGEDRYAGWAIVVAYRDPAAAPRNLSVFDGLTVVSQSATTATIGVSGFKTAPEGPVRTTLGAIAYEGDLGKTGDGMKLGTTVLGNAVNPSDDFFNSSVSAGAARVTTGRAPAQNNHFGFDADLIGADGILANNATAATITVNTAASGGETIYPGVLTFASELLAAKIRPATTVTDVNAGNVEPGDVLEYVTVAENSGNADATELTLRSNLPAGVELVADSLEILDGPGAGGPFTMADDTDNVVYDGPGRTINWRLGSGATPSVGGTLPKDATTTVRYRVRVLAPPNGASLPTNVNAAYGTATTTDHYTTTGTGGGGITVKGPDLALDIARTGTLGRGETPSYTITVTNAGAAPHRGLVRVTDELPAGLDVTATPSGTGWSCSVAGRTITCDRSSVLAIAEAYPTIGVPVQVRQDAASTAIVNAATVTGASDGIHTNDSDADDGGAPFSQAALSIALARSVGTLSPGETATLTATVTNAGPSDATGVQVALPLPSGLELVSATTGATTCVITTCAVGTVAADDTATAVYEVRAVRAAAGTTQSATATLTSATTDTTTGDDGAAASLVVKPQRRVSVAQTISPDAPVAGSAATLNVTVANDGPSAASDVVLTEALPSALRSPSVTADADEAECAITAGTLSCALAGLAADASVTIEVAGTVAAGAAGETLAATAAVDAVADDVTTDDDSATVSRTVGADPRLAVTTLTAPDRLRAGEQGTWVFRAAPAGPSDATGVTLRVPLPAGLRPVGTVPGCTVAASELVCALGTVNAGTHRDVSVTLELAPDAPALPLVLAPTLDGVTPDPAAAATTPVTREADLGITQQHGPAELVAGSAASFTSTVRNTGPSDATGVVITQRIPAGLRGVSAGVRDDRGTCSVADGVVTCRFARLADGEAVVIDVRGTVGSDMAGRPVESTVSVDAAEADPKPEDDTATTRPVPAAVNDLSVAAFAPAGVVAAGKTAEVTFLVRNDGPSDATQVVLTGTLPDGAQVYDLDPRCTMAGQVVTCTIGAVAVGQERPIVLRVRALHAFDGAQLGAAASVRGAGRDLAPANDSLAPVAAAAVLPSCTSRRKFEIRLRVPARSRLTSVKVTVAGRPVKVRVGKRLTAVVDLRGRPAGRIVTRIVAVTRAGRKLVGTRAYQTCTVKRPAGRPPRI